MSESGYLLDELLVADSHVGPITYPIDLADTLVLSDAITAPVGRYFTDTLGVSDALGTIGSFLRGLQDTLHLGDQIQAFSRRMHGGAAVEWRNPARLAETPWTPRGTCACGLGHVGPQGCNAFIGAGVGEPLTLSDALTLETIGGGVIDTGRLLTCGFEEGEAVSHLRAGVNQVVSVLFDTVGGVTDVVPMATDIVHSGSYSIRMFSGGPGIGGFSDKIRKAINPALNYPCSFGSSHYVYWVSMDGNLTANRGLTFSGLSNSNGDYDSIANGCWNIDGSHMKLFLRKGRFELNKAFGTYAMSVGIWYRFDVWCTVQADGSYSATAQVYSDSGTLLDSITIAEGAGTFSTATPINFWAFTPTYGINPSPSDMRFDDLALFSKVGPYGPRKIVIAVPNSTVLAQFTPQGGAVSNQTAIDDLPSTWDLLDGEYNLTTLNGQIDRFGLTNLIPSGKRLQLVDLYLNGSPGGNGMTLSVFEPTGFEMQSPNIRSDGTVLPLTGADGGHIAVAYPSAPGARLSDLTVAYRSTSPQTGGQRITHRLWANVEYGD